MTQMDSNFYCEECETQIDDDEVAEHEAQGHTVRGTIRPKRLLSQDPWERTDADEGGDESVSGDPG